MQFTHDFFDAYQHVEGDPVLIHRQVALSRPLVIMVRDPLDVGVSYYYHLKYRLGEEHESLEEFLRSPVYGLARQTDFVHKLLDLYEAHPSRRLALVYRSVRRQPEVWLRALLSFVYGVVDEEAYAHAFEASTFEAMKSYELSLAPASVERRLGLRHCTQDDVRALKVRRGEVGGYRHELSESALTRVEGMPAVRRLRERLRRFDEAR